MMIPLLLPLLACLLTSTSLCCAKENATVRRARSDVCLWEVCNATSSVCAGISTVDERLKCMSIEGLDVNYIINIFHHRHDWLTFHDVVSSKIFNADDIAWYDTPHVIDRVRWDVNFEGRLVKIHTTDEIYLVRFFGVDPTYHGERHHSTTVSPTTVATTRRRRHSSTISPPPDTTTSTLRPTTLTSTTQPRRHSTTTMSSPSTRTSTSSSRSTKMSTTTRALTTSGASSTPPPPPPTSMQWTSRPTSSVSLYTTSATTTVELDTTTTSSSTQPPPHVEKGYSLAALLGSLFGGLLLGCCLFPLSRVAVQGIAKYRGRRRSMDMFYVSPTVRVVDNTAAVPSVLGGDYEPTF